MIDWSEAVDSKIGIFTPTYFLMMEQFTSNTATKTYATIACLIKRAVIAGSSASNASRALGGDGLPLQMKQQ